MPKKKKISDSRLSGLWSKAVKIKYKRCPITGETDNLESHHAVPKGWQNRFPIRWEIRNGIPLRPDIHRRVTDGDLEIQRQLTDYLERRGDLEYLMSIRNMVKHDYLKHIKMTEDEYRYHTMKTLKEIVDNG